MRSLTALWRAIVEQKTGRLTRCTVGPLLTAIAWPYDWAHQLRLRLYTRGWASVKRLPCRVLSVGNLTLGGTGKTPLVEAIAILLRDKGYRVGVLSRGYGGKRRESIIVVSDGKRCLASPDVAGDEPVLLAEHLPGVPVLVGKDRYMAGVLAAERFGVEVAVLDDGFQHLQLARDLDILVLDAARPFGNGRLFPRGDLRERPSALTRADAVVLTHWESSIAISTSVLPLPHPIPPLFRSQHEALDLHVLQDGQTLPLASLKGRRVLAFCGIGTPESFQRILNSVGAAVVGFIPFPDHHPYTRRELEGLGHAAQAHNAEVMVTTEKDGIWLRRLLPLAWPVWALRIRATIVDQEAAWEACILRALTKR